MFAHSTDTTAELIALIWSRLDVQSASVANLLADLLLNDKNGELRESLTPAERHAVDGLLIELSHTPINKQAFRAAFRALQLTDRARS